MTPKEQIVHAVKMLPWMYLNMVVWLAATFTVGFAFVGLLVLWDMIFY